jgi:arylsulfatase
MVRASVSRTAAGALWGLLCLAGPAAAEDLPGRLSLPAVPTPFEGNLNAVEEGSTPWYPVSQRAPEGAPNVLLVMTDDVGFGAASTFGGPVPTPSLDRLAANGLRYNRFHTTAICSPTRAALLTGRNHHAIGTGFLADVASPYPGYTTRIPRSAATVARILRDNGYNTAMFGKDHNVPTADRSPAGPYEHWPTGRGFEHFYGFVAGDTNQWRPALFDGTTPVDGRHRPDDYLLDEELVDHAITWLHNQQAAAPGKPFFMYYAPGTAHAPLQAPQDWIARFKGQFDHGWDVERERILARQKAAGIVPENTRLAARPAEIPAWDSQSPAEQAIYARHMEVFAAMLSYQDAQFGRLVNELERMGLADNTLVLFIQGDNGGSGEGGHHGTLNELAHLSGEELVPATDWLLDNLDILGGPDTYMGFPVGWAFATSTPFPWVKQIASHLGGVRNGLVVSWPGRIEQAGGVRPQYHHVIDVVPTILEATGIPAPETVDGVAQQAIDGKSMLYSFDNADAPSRRTTQYYEILGNRGIYHEGWLANTVPRNMPWEIARVRAGSDVTSYEWELYNLQEDYSQSNNLAAKHPEKLQDMQAVFDAEARRYQVYPVHDTGAMARMTKVMRMPGASFGFTPRKTLWGPDIRLSLAAAPPIFMLPFGIDADIEVPEGGANGVIVAAGSYFGGWSFYLDEGVPVAVAAVSPQPGGEARVAATEPLPAGRHKLRFEFSAAGELTILVNGEERAKGPVERKPPIMAGGGETFDTGRDSNDPVSRDYADEGVFTGTIHRIDVAVMFPRQH